MYHFFAHYREHIMRELMQDLDWEFEMISDSETVSGIKGIDPELAKLPTEAGGLRWNFVKNCYIFGKRFPFIWQKGLHSRLSRDDYDAVIFLGNMYFLSTWFAALRLRKAGKLVLFWTHGVLNNDNGLIPNLRHRFYKLANGFLLYGDRARELMFASGHYDERQLCVIYNSLDYDSMNRLRETMTSELRAALRAELFTDPSLPTVVAVGRVNRSKRFDLLLPALSMLDHKNIKYNCLIIGDGPQLFSLKEATLTLGLKSRFCFYGPAYGDEVNQLLLACDLCVIPGDVGLSAMHAMSAGLAVVSHNAFERQMPEYEAIKEGETGSFYVYGSTEDLAAKIEWWLSSTQRLSTARNNCLEQINGKFNATYQVEKICEALETLRDD